MNAVTFPHFRLDVMQALASLASARLKSSDWLSFGNGSFDRFKLVWDVLIEDHRVSHASRRVGEVFVEGDEVRLLESCGTALEACFEKHESTIMPDHDWREVVLSPEWPEIESAAANALFEMVGNWAFPPFE